MSIPHRSETSLPPTTTPLRVVMLAFADVQILDVTGPLEVFAMATQMLAMQGAQSPGYAIELVAEKAGPVASSSGPEPNALRAWQGLRGGIDTLPVPGGLGTEAAARAPTLIRWLSKEISHTRDCKNARGFLLPLAREHAGLRGRLRRQEHPLRQLLPSGLPRQRPHHRGGIRCVRDPQGPAWRLLDMDTKRIPSKAFGRAAARRIKAEIETMRPDVVTASDDNAPKYLIMPYCRDAELRFVFCREKRDDSAYGFPYRKVTGMVEVALAPEILAHLKHSCEGRAYWLHRQRSSLGVQEP